MFLLRGDGFRRKRAEQKAYGPQEEHGNTGIYAPKPTVVDEFEFGHRAPTAFFPVVTELIDVPIAVTKGFIDANDGRVAIAILSVKNDVAAKLLGFGMRHDERKTIVEP